MVLNALPGALILTLGILNSAPPTQAEDLKCKLISMMTKIEMNNIEDQKGHVVGIYERKGITIYDNGEVADESNHGWFDGNEGGGKWQGYCLQTFKDGSTMMMKYQGTDANDRIVECTWELIQGTGRFEGIKGKGIMTGDFYGKFENSIISGTYTVKK
jgi:hypothetical protein